MMYVRGSLQDYDDWAELAEDEGWSAETMQLYMRKHQVCADIVTSAFHVFFFSFSDFKC